MDIVISGISKVGYKIRYEGITHVLSLLRGPERNELYIPSDFDRNNWLFIDMDDVINPDAVCAPTKDQVVKLLGWGRLLPPNSKLLVHCYAGISRSTAAALALKVQHLGNARLKEAIDWLMKERSIACPNPVITKYADEILGCEGALHAAAEKIASTRLLDIYGEIDVDRSHMRK